MIGSETQNVSFLAILLLIFVILNEASVNVLRRKTTSDDEDSSPINNKIIESSGNGPARPPDVYPSLDPYTRTRSTATILVDVAFDHSYMSYMLPGSAMTPQLRSFHNDIIENFKNELHSIYVKLEYKILSIRPGPLIPKKMSFRSDVIRIPSVFVRMNITQQNSSIVNPLIIFHISQCGRRGILGNLTISDQIIFPQYVCNDKQVYCLPDCRYGAYCDGKSDCPETNLDETSSCPKCLYKDVNLIANTQEVNEDEELHFKCNFNRKCEDLRSKIRWSFPLQLKSYEEFYKGNSRVESLPKNLLTSGVYRCIIDGESSSTNISIIRKPIVYLTKGEPDAETVIISEIDGQNVTFWCNTTEGFAIWLPVNMAGVTISNYNEKCSQMSFNEIKKEMSKTYDCQVLWGNQKSKVINKSLKIIVLCDVKHHFECKQPSSGRSCIPIEQKCDTIKQCEDGSDEKDCNFCSEKELSVDVGSNIVADVGDTIIMECLSTKNTCKPLSWWTRGNMISTEENMARFKDSLFIVNIQTHHSGLYQCFDAWNKTSVGVQVHVDPAPKLRLSPRVNSINITYGQSKVVNCFANYPQNIKYKKNSPYWTVNNQEILTNDVRVISRGKTLSKIMFNNAHYNMTGDYHCEVVWGTMNKKVVRVAMKVNINPLICKDGEKICGDNKMCLADSFWCDGTIQCEDGSDERSCDRCTNGFVFVQPSSVTVLTGQTTELHCYYDKECYPVTWRIAGSKDPLTSVDGISLENNKLIIKNVKLESSNIYECYSGSKISQSNVTVISQVELTLSSTYAFVDYGQNIDVDCQSNYGQPQWRRRDLKPLSQVKGAHQSHTNPNAAKLFIHSPSYDAKGYYMCFVRLSKSDVDAASSLMFVHIHDLKCPQNHLLCDQKTKCVPNLKLCDLEHDCKDGADERNCSKCNDVLEVRPKQLIITRQGYGVFQCIVPNKDCLPIEWKSKSNKILIGPRFYKFDSFLYILSPKLSDAGEIICTNGQKSSSSVLIVKDLILTFKPNQSDDSTIYMMRGQSRRISCKSNLGTPSWIYPEESSVSQFGIRFINTNENESILDITNIMVGASRKYVCYVLFSRESKKISLSIKVM